MATAETRAPDIIIRGRKVVGGAADGGIEPACAQSSASETWSGPTSATIWSMWRTIASVALCEQTMDCTIRPDHALIAAMVRLRLAEIA